MKKLGMFGKHFKRNGAEPAPFEMPDTITVSQHARDRYEDRFRPGLSTSQIDSQIARMLNEATVADEKQKRAIENSCSHEIRNHYLYSSEYEQYVYGGYVVICIAWKEKAINDQIVKTKHVTTIYYI